MKDQHLTLTSIAELLEGFSFWLEEEVRLKAVASYNCWKIRDVADALRARASKDNEWLFQQFLKEREAKKDE